MRYKLTLALSLAVMALALPTAVVKPSAPPTAPVVKLSALPTAPVVKLNAPPTAPVVKLNAPPTAPTVSVPGECIAGQKLLCIAEVDGGTPPYTYQWGPAPEITGSGQMKIVPCAGTGSRIISVTVTDANGEVGYFSSSFGCCGGVTPQ